MVKNFDEFISEKFDYRKQGKEQGKEISETEKLINDIRENCYVELNNSKIKNFFFNNKVYYSFCDFIKILLEKFIEEYRMNDEREFLYADFKLTFKAGKKYIGVFERSVVNFFIDKFGNVYKPASYRTPANGVRAYIDNINPNQVDIYGGWLYSKGGFLNPYDETHW